MNHWPNVLHFFFFVGKAMDELLDGQKVLDLSKFICFFQTYESKVIFKPYALKFLHN